MPPGSRASRVAYTARIPHADRRWVPISTGGSTVKASPSSAAQGSTGEALTGLLPSWRRSLAARRISPRTIATYTTSVEQLTAFLAERGMPTSVAGIRREHVEAFLEDLLGRKSPATAHNRF